MREKSSSSGALSSLSAAYARRDGEAFLGPTTGKYDGVNRDSTLSVSRDNLFNVNPRLSRVSTSTDLTDIERTSQLALVQSFAVPNNLVFLVAEHLPIHMGSSLPAYVDYEDDYFAPLPNVKSSLHASRSASASYAETEPMSKLTRRGGGATRKVPSETYQSASHAICSARGFINVGTLLVLLLALLSLFLVYPVAHWAVTSHPDVNLGFNVGAGGASDDGGAGATPTPTDSSTDTLDLPIPTTTDPADPNPLIPGPFQTA